MQGYQSQGGACFSEPLNKGILALLLKTLGLEDDSGKKRDLRELCGTWNKDQFAEFKNNTEQFNMIDSEIWKEL